MIEKFYVDLISSRLENFEWKGANVANFKCVFCGDSKTNKNKKRGYLFRKGDHFSYFCHNCGESKSFRNFLHDYDPVLYKRYIFEKFKNKTNKTNTDDTPTITPKSINYDRFDLPTINELPKDSVHYEYLKNRKIPEKYFDKLYFAYNFKEFVESLNIPDFEMNLFQESRIIIPYHDSNGKIFAFQGRSINSTLRYITIKLSDKPKIFGLDSWNELETTHIVEGPFDSMFLDNALAMSGLDINSEVIKMLNPKKTIFIFDNEPRNSFVIRNMEKIAKLGFSCLIWPEYITQKDINDMVLNNVNISYILQHCVYSGIKLKFLIKKYKKC